MAAELKEYKKVPTESDDDAKGLFSSDYEGDSEKRTMRSSARMRRRLGWLAIFSAIVLVIAAIVIILVAVKHRSNSSPQSDQPETKRQMSLADLFSPKMMPRQVFGAKWMPASSKLYRVLDGPDYALVQTLDVLQVNSTTEQPWTDFLLLPYQITRMGGYSYGSLQFSPDERFVLFGVQGEGTQSLLHLCNLFRHGRTVKVSLPHASYERRTHTLHHMDQDRHQSGIDR